VVLLSTTHILKSQSQVVLLMSCEITLNSLASLDNLMKKGKCGAQGFYFCGIWRELCL